MSASAGEQRSQCVTVAGRPPEQAERTGHSETGHVGSVRRRPYRGGRDAGPGGPARAPARRTSISTSTARMRRERHISRFACTASSGAVGIRSGGTTIRSGGRSAKSARSACAGVSPSGRRRACESLGARQSASGETEDHLADSRWRHGSHDPPAKEAPEHDRCELLPTGDPLAERTAHGCLQLAPRHAGVGPGQLEQCT